MDLSDAFAQISHNGREEECERTTIALWIDKVEIPKTNKQKSENHRMLFLLPSSFNLFFSSSLLQLIILVNFLLLVPELVGSEQDREDSPDSSEVEGTTKP